MILLTGSLCYLVLEAKQLNVLETDNEYDLMNHIIDDIDHMIVCADRWIEARIDYFSPLGNWQDKKDRFLRRKAFAEAAIYMYVTEQLDGRPKNNQMRGFFIDFVNQKEFRDLVLRKANQLLLYGAAVNYVKTIGHLSQATEAAVLKVLSRKPVWAVERVPNRILDLWNFIEVFGYVNKVADVKSIINLSCLNHQLDVIDSTLHDVYAFTHVLLFYYNFGVFNIQIKNEKLTTDIESCLIGLVMRYCAENNFDVVLELLYVGALHKQLPRWLVEYVFVQLQRQQQADGIVRGPDNPDKSSLTGKSDDYIIWAENYHTVLVSASTFRVIRKNWVDIDLQVSDERRLLDAGNFNLLEQCGHVLFALSRYELPLAICLLKELIGEGSKCKLVNEMVSYCKDYIEQQKDEEGNYGYWSDERELFCLNGGTKEQFKQELADPITDMCRELATEV
ncbi:DUF6895 family protein [Spartinivicinus poritis]|uniref:DUF6895 domain-containing protein n=1 Tax=Spartinivicinus poritis TaxID=2994640 RepID=A0ABT5UF61_9GAMM|nr:hypothetical protein [Spartinivicinus sp. A2-2]MDE1465019.1 hypothetical protein [Spartinivicinus sp. A2-2]